MFDIGFGEILVILVILLLVVGPERLPAVARTTAIWIRKAKRLLTQVKHEVERELQAEDLRQSLKENKDLLDLNEANGKSALPKPNTSQEKRPDKKASNNGA